MAPQQSAPTRMTVTASLTTGIACVARGRAEAVKLVDQIVRTDHVEWETTLYVGDVEFHTSKAGPFPNHQLRISVRPSASLAALMYIDHDDPIMSVAISFSPAGPAPDVKLVFNGAIGSVFPRSAAIPVIYARAALLEWLDSRRRPTCIDWVEWCPF